MTGVFTLLKPLVAPKTESEQGKEMVGKKGEWMGIDDEIFYQEGTA